MYFPVKFMLISGNGGARADFVAGWLGLNPNFINSFWNIDVNTGLSVGEQGSARSIGSGQDIEHIANEFQLTLDANATTTWALAIHPYNLDINNLVDYISQQKISFVDINTSTADQTKINWEFFVKTYLTKRRGINQHRNKEFWVIDNQIDKLDITDADRAQKANEILLAQNSNHNRYFPLSDKLIPIVVNYDVLFKNGGSKYLTDKLQIDMPDLAHQYWNDALKYANSPNEMWAFNKIWKNPYT